MGVNERGQAQTVRYNTKANIFHQDVKPANILLMENGDGVEELVLADFGVAKMAEDDPDKSGIVMNRPFAVTGDGTDGRTDPASHHHISFEMTDIINRLSSSMRKRADGAGIENGSEQFERSKLEVGGDLAKYMSHLIIDESSDTCK